MIEIISAGMLSTVQDLGRFKVMKNGFTQSGVMDAYSTKIANKLCKNDVNAPVIEMTMLGITAKFKGEHIFAISGGIFDISLNGNLIRTNKAYVAKDGDVLSIKGAKQGLRCYLAVAGGFDVPLFMGSASTNLKINVGGFNGRKLKAGDILKIGKADKIKNIEKRELPENTYNNTVRVRVVLGPQDDMFSENDLMLFSKQQYTVTSDIDRMGIRLWGIALRGKEKLEIISDAITFGSIQITNSGMPIILMADHQTTGGYAKIATVISADLPKLAQVKPNDKISFEIIDIDTAEKAAIKQKKFIDKLF
ncbi:biotin-dependent carboxyltransferase family protein [uncultured Eubacterium sp.]|uniref:5-oxoprolinase subunit C family protein n=1 Tax=uncultured Eubacterium sp. TaxID=165185 RepID=UPI0025D68CE0|nr:biotin-dependent carboxyltransferase family protein [uncultured Eubacterium sp.]